MGEHLHGHLIVVVGPSGAGKDSLLRAGKEAFESNPHIDFVKRVITRECDPATEIHDSVTEAQFLEQQSEGAFCVHWQANGLYYGLPSSVQAQLAQGQILIANGSRAALPAIRSAFDSLTIVHVTVDSSVLAERLSRRSRESREQIEKRLERNKTIASIDGDDVISIDNSGAREVAIDEFISLVKQYTL